MKSKNEGNKDQDGDGDSFEGVIDAEQYKVHLNKKNSQDKIINIKSIDKQQNIDDIDNNHKDESSEILRQLIDDSKGKIKSQQLIESQAKMQEQKLLKQNNFHSQILNKGDSNLSLEKLKDKSNKNNNIKQNKINKSNFAENQENQKYNNNNKFDKDQNIINNSNNNQQKSKEESKIGKSLLEIFEQEDKEREDKQKQKLIIENNLNKDKLSPNSTQTTILEENLKKTAFTKTQHVFSTKSNWLKIKEKAQRPKSPDDYINNKDLYRGTLPYAFQNKIVVNKEQFFQLRSISPDPSNYKIDNNKTKFMVFSPQTKDTITRLQQEFELFNQGNQPQDQAIQQFIAINQQQKQQINNSFKIKQQQQNQQQQDNKQLDNFSPGVPFKYKIPQNVHNDNYMNTLYLLGEKETVKQKNRQIIQFDSNFIDQIQRLRGNIIDYITDESYTSYNLYQFQFLIFEVKVKDKFPMTIDIQLNKGKLELFSCKQPYACWSQFDNYFNFFDRPIQITYDTRNDQIKTVHLSIFCLKDATFKIKYKFRIDIFGDFQTTVINNIDNQLQLKTDNQFEQINKNLTKDQQLTQLQQLDQMSEFDRQFMEEELQIQKKLEKMRINVIRRDIVMQNKINAAQFKTQKYQQEKEQEKEKKQIRIIKNKFIYFQNSLEKKNNQALQIILKDEKAIEQNNENRILQEKSLLKSKWEYSWMQLLILSLFTTIIKYKIFQKKLSNVKYQMAVFKLGYFFINFSKKLNKKSLPLDQRYIHLSKLMINQRIKIIGKQKKKESKQLIVFIYKTLIRSLQIQQLGKIYYDKIQKIQKKIKEIQYFQSKDIETLEKMWGVVIKEIMEDEEISIEKQIIKNRVLPYLLDIIEEKKTSVLKKYYQQQLIKFREDMKEYNTMINRYLVLDKHSVDFCDFTLTILFKKKMEKQMHEHFDRKNFRKQHQEESQQLFQYKPIYKLSTESLQKIRKNLNFVPLDINNYLEQMKKQQGIKIKIFGSRERMALMGNSILNLDINTIKPLNSNKKKTLLQQKSSLKNSFITKRSIQQSQDYIDSQNSIRDSKQFENKKSISQIKNEESIIQTQPQNEEQEQNQDENNTSLEKIDEQMDQDNTSINIENKKDTQQLNSQNEDNLNIHKIDEEENEDENEIEETQQIKDDQSVQQQIENFLTIQEEDEEEEDYVNQKGKQNNSQDEIIQRISVEKIRQSNNAIDQVVQDKIQDIQLENKQEKQEINNDQIILKKNSSLYSQKSLVESPKLIEDNIVESDQESDNVDDEKVQEQIGKFDLQVKKQLINTARKSVYLMENSLTGLISQQSFQQQPQNQQNNSNFTPRKSIMLIDPPEHQAISRQNTVKEILELDEEENINQQEKQSPLDQNEGENEKLQKQQSIQQQQQLQVFPSVSQSQNSSQQQSPDNQQKKHGNEKKDKKQKKEKHQKSLNQTEAQQQQLEKTDSIQPFSLKLIPEEDLSSQVQQQSQQEQENEQTTELNLATSQNLAHSMQISQNTGIFKNKQKKKQQQQQTKHNNTEKESKNKSQAEEQDFESSTIQKSNMLGSSSTKDEEQVQIQQEQQYQPKRHILGQQKGDTVQQVKKSKMYSIKKRDGKIQEDTSIIQQLSEQDQQALHRFTQQSITMMSTRHESNVGMLGAYDKGKGSKNLKKLKKKKLKPERKRTDNEDISNSRKPQMRLLPSFYDMKLMIFNLMDDLLPYSIGNMQQQQQ